MSKAAALRAALQRPPVRVVGVHDGLGARLAEEAGFDAVWASGLEISTAAGVPDANILTMTELLAAAVQIDQATSLPVVADCDTGFGNSNNVLHMVRRYESAGIAAVCMEDKRFPKVNSFVPGRQELAPVGEFVGKLLAACSARRSQAFLVIARVEALIAGHGMDEALRRAEAYAGAGADAILLHSKHGDPSEARAFLERWDGRAPVVLVPTTYPQWTAERWADAGASMIIWANHGLRASIAAVQSAFADLRADDTPAALEPRLVDLHRVFELSGMTRMKQDEARFLRDERRPVRALVLAGGDLQLPDDLAAVLDGGSRAELDLLGRPLVDHQRQALVQAGAREVRLVGDFPEAPAAGLEVVPCCGTSLLETVRAGLADDPLPGGCTLLCYSDIVFGPRVVEALLQAVGDVIVLVDRGFRRGGRAGRKALDLVETDPPPAAGARELDPPSPRRVTRIGKALDATRAPFEFVGLCALSEAGHRRLREACARWDREHVGPFGEAPSFARAGLTDALQVLVDEGVPVHIVEQDRGWMEIHSLEDYRAATAALARGRGGEVLGAPPPRASDDALGVEAPA